ncbi:MAG TPA: DoxX family protein [Candidatus Acidoferrales bacterium]|nr:DoxX family protein [Candidatus Acidoferrales bacterium]
MVDDFGLLTARSAVGLALASHGAQKAFGWFEGPGPQGAAQFMESLGFVPGERYALAASYAEIAAGTLMTLGLLGALGPALLLSTQSVAATTVHAKNGFYATKGGVELNTLYIAATLALTIAGPGKYSLDELLGLQILHTPLAKWLTLAGGLGGGIFMLTRRLPRKPLGEGAPSNNGAPGAPQEVAASS